MKTTEIHNEMKLQKVETSGATFTSSKPDMTTLEDLRQSGWNINEDDEYKLEEGQTVYLTTYNLAGTPRKIQLKKANS